MPQLEQTPQPDVPALEHVDVWVFDLDNTLYPAASNLFDQIDKRIGQFIAHYLKVDLVEARKLQKQFFREYGTTLRGLMTVHGMPPGAFLDYVHDIDLSPIEPSAGLDEALHQLEGRKLIFTNGSVSHAEGVMNRLGVEHHFEAVFDIAAADFVPKPQLKPYQDLIARYGINARASAMVEDMAKNLKPAHDLGMTTVWVPGQSAWSHEGFERDHVHHVAEDLVLWITGVNRSRQTAAAG